MLYLERALTLCLWIAMLLSPVDRGGRVSRSSSTTMQKREREREARSRPPCCGATAALLQDLTALPDRRKRRHRCGEDASAGARQFLCLASFCFLLSKTRGRRV